MLFRFLALVFLLIGANAAMAIEWVGLLSFQKSSLFALRVDDKSQSKWVGQNETFEGFTVNGLDQDGLLVLSGPSREKVKLSLYDAKVHAQVQLAPVPREDALKFLYGILVNTRGKLQHHNKTVEDYLNDPSVPEEQRRRLRELLGKRGIAQGGTPAVPVEKLLAQAKGVEVQLKPLDKVDFDPRLVANLTEEDWQKLSQSSWSTPEAQEAVRDLQKSLDASSGEKAK